MTIKDYGPNGLLVELGSDINAETNMLVHDLRRQLIESPESTIEFVTPAYNSLVVSYAGDEKTKSTITEITENLTGTQHATAVSDHWRLPVCYDPDFGLDIESLSQDLGLSMDEIIELHSKTFRVFTCGFLPGFPYMGTTDDKLFTKRKNNPRPLVEAGSVGLAGNQTGIYPVNSPGGWQIIGRTPIQIIRSDSEFPFFIKPGDSVQFYSIDKDEFEKLSQADVNGEIDIKKLKSN